MNISVEEMSGIELEPYTKEFRKDNGINKVIMDSRKQNKYSRKYFNTLHKVYNSIQHNEYIPKKKLELLIENFLRDHSPVLSILYRKEEITYTDMVWAITQLNKKWSEQPLVQLKLIQQIQLSLIKKFNHDKNIKTDVRELMGYLKQLFVGKIDVKYSTEAYKGLDTEFHNMIREFKSKNNIKEIIKAKNIAENEINRVRKERDSLQFYLDKANEKNRVQGESSIKLRKRENDSIRKLYTGTIKKYKEDLKELREELKKLKDNEGEREREKKRKMEVGKSYMINQNIMSTEEDLLSFMEEAIAEKEPDNLLKEKNKELSESIHKANLRMESFRNKNDVLKKKNKILLEDIGKMEVLMNRLRNRNLNKPGQNKYKVYDIKITKEGKEVTDKWEFYTNREINYTPEIKKILFDEWNLDMEFINDCFLSEMKTNICMIEKRYNIYSRMNSLRKHHIKILEDYASVTKSFDRERFIWSLYSINYKNKNGENK
jgi:hypothetical protein